MSSIYSQERVRWSLLVELHLSSNDMGAQNICQEVKVDTNKTENPSKDALGKTDKETRLD